MSDPRMIPADDAKVTLDAVNQAIGDGFSFPDTYVRDLAYTVIEQAAQLDRVREVLAWAEQAEDRAHADWIRTADTHHRDVALAYTQTATWLRYALGDNDE